MAKKYLESEAFRMTISYAQFTFASRPCVPKKQTRKEKGRTKKNKDKSRKQMKIKKRTHKQ